MSGGGEGRKELGRGEGEVMIWAGYDSLSLKGERQMRQGERQGDSRIKAMELALRMMEHMLREMEACGAWTVEVETPMGEEMESVTLTRKKRGKRGPYKKDGEKRKKRTISPEAKAAMIAGTKRRWARIRREKKMAERGKK